MSLAGLLHGIPTGLVLPMIVAPAENEAVFGPDDLRPDIKASRH